MRRAPPLIVGAGPAGSMAAIALCRAGAPPTLVDRDAEVGDALCGGFLSWRTVGRLRAVGIDPGELCAHPVERLVLVAGEQEGSAKLPAPGFGLSRRALDGALRNRAVALGARLEIDRIRTIEPGLAVGEGAEHPAEALFLATGKHDVRGQARPREAKDPALGLRVRLPASDGLRALLAGRIELHLFARGYAGVVLQEDGSANVCLAVRKSLLGDAGGDPRSLLDRLAAAHPRFGERMAYCRSAPPIDTIGAVPYEWIAGAASPGIWRLGDQAAVIPSLAGEGMAIALASGEAAAGSWLRGESASAYQSALAARARRPVRIAGTVWTIAERPLGGRLAAWLAARAPALARRAMELTRIG